MAGDRDAPSIANAAAHRAFLEDQIDQVARGNAVWAYGTTSPNGVFTPGPGAEIGAVPPEQIAAMGGHPQTVAVTDPMGGTVLQVQASGTPIYGKITDADGNEIAAKNGNPIGYEYKVYKGGQVITSYGFQSKDNGWIISNDPPWRNDLPAIHRSDGGNRLEVDFTSVYNDTIAEHGGQLRAGDYGNGIVATSNRNGKITVSYDPQSLSYSTDERHVTGSHDPNTDFHSLTLATYTQTFEGLRDLKQAVSDTNSLLYKQLFNDAARYAGGQFDELNQLIPGTADQNKLNAAMGVVDRAAQSTDYSHFVNKGGTQWSRDTTGSVFQTSGQTPVGGPGASGSQASGTLPLPSDALRNAPGWQSFANAFTPGTNQFARPSDIGGDGGFSIRTSGTITVPGMPPPQAAGWQNVYGPSAGPTNPVSAPQQTGKVYGPPKPPPAPTYGHEAHNGTGGY
jgi:hypothetical protein